MAARMTTVEVTCFIRGTSPLLWHAYSPQFQNSDATRPQVREQQTPRDVAEAACYRDNDGFVYFPGAAIARMAREAGASHKLTGSRRQAKFVVPAALLVLQDQVHILDKNGEWRTDFEVDSRPVTNPSTKGRIMGHRPRWDDWQATFDLQIDPEVLPVDFIHRLVEEGGRRIGIGDYRPEKGGPFGRFEIIGWRDQRNGESESLLGKEEAPVSTKRRTRQ